MDVPFHLIYDSLICFKGLQSDRPKCKRLLADPGEYQNMIIKYLSVGLQSWFSYQQVALNPLFQMRYDSLPNSEKQPSDSQRGSSNSCFHISLVLFLLPASKTCLSNLVSHSVTSWSRWGYHISFERGDLEHHGVQKFWNFLIDRYKLSRGTNNPISHGFGMLRGLPTVSYILVCHSATPWSISNCHTSSERGLKYLSYNPNCLYITLQISLCEHQS